MTTRRIPGGVLVFLENGSSKAGLQHIVGGRADNFAVKGASEAGISEFVTKAATEGRRVGSQDQGQGRPIYEVDFNGATHQVAVTVGSNGFIVGANPRS